MSVSIILPTCQRPGLLHRAIASVLAQSDPDWQLVVVNDGGAHSVDEHRKRHADPRIVWLETAGRTGVSSARNAGLAAATGDWLAFLDDDDELLPEFVAALKAFVATEQPDFCWCGIEKAESGRQRLWHTDSRRDGSLMFITQVAACCGLALSRGAYERLGGFDAGLKTSEDRELMLRLIAAGCRYAALPRALVRLHPHTGARLSDVRADRDKALASAADDERLLQAHAALLARDPPARDEYLKHLAGKYFHAGDARGFRRAFARIGWAGRMDLKLLRRAARMAFRT